MKFIYLLLFFIVYIFDLHYFGNINYYITLLNFKNIEFAPQLPFQKGWFSNKCEVASATGTLKLTIPILGGRNQKALLKDVRIAYHENWRHRHLRAIETCYGNSAFFDFYFLEFDNLFKKHFNFLIDLNLHAHDVVMGILKSNQKYIISEKVLNHNEVLFSKFYSSNLNTQNFKLKYEQVFENKNGFIENLSIIDLIFCMGPQAFKHLKKS